MPTSFRLKDSDPGYARSSITEQTSSHEIRERSNKGLIIAGVAVAIVLIGLLGVGLYFLLQPGTPTDRIRDVFIILVALETLLVGAALVVLLVQLASLLNLLQNEVRPMLQATSETISTLRGTAEFLGETVVEPVMKLNGYLASIQRVLELIGVKRK